jgi:hypothetical protein
VDSDEARAILDAELVEFDKCSYDELRTLVGAPTVTKTVDGRTGVRYQVETRVVWDAEQGGDLRVVGCVDDGGLRLPAFDQQYPQRRRVTRCGLPAWPFCHPAFLPC